METPQEGFKEVNHPFQNSYKEENDWTIQYRSYHSFIELLKAGAPNGFQIHPQDRSIPDVSKAFDIITLAPNVSNSRNWNLSIHKTPDRHRGAAKKRRKKKPQASTNTQIVQGRRGKRGTGGCYFSPTPKLWLGKPLKGVPPFEIFLLESRKI